MFGEHGAQVQPGVFCDAVSRCEMGATIDRWALTNVLRRLRSPDSELISLTLCSIDLTGQSVRDETFLDFLTQRLHEPGVDATKICFELTETVIMENPSRAKEFVRQLRRRGCKFSVDHFGTGLSALAFLRELAPDFLKIDGSFVRELTRNPPNRDIVRTTIVLAQSMNIKTIAECTDSRETLETLRRLGVDYAQGPWVSVPQPL